MSQFPSIEKDRLSLQTLLDAGKTAVERNKLGQFATPTALALDIVKFGLSFFSRKQLIRFLDPAFGTGSFFSALLENVPIDRIEKAKGFELDDHYSLPAKQLWENTLLDLEAADFTKTKQPSDDAQRFNLIICNPPYVRHHHIINEEKVRLRNITVAACGIRIAGLAGLYCYFLGLSHGWMQRGGLAGWLIPSEFMDVNYGEAVKRYLLEKVTLLRIHRFDPNDLQFDDALVSSAVVWFRNDPPPANHEIEFTFGGSHANPTRERRVKAAALRNETKWTRFPVYGVRESAVHFNLSDLFSIKRGIATGSNEFFILANDEIRTRNLPIDFFRPILPSPRYLATDEIQSDEKGLPLLDRQLFLLDCRLPEIEIKRRFPSLWTYLESGKGAVSKRYLCQSRKLWYSQDTRDPAPILCTYMGRQNTKNGKPFRFILNHSQAIAANVYLLMYPKALLANAIDRDASLLRRIWEKLNDLSLESVLGEGRVYGGGLHKLEPNELANVDATSIAQIIPHLRQMPKKVAQMDMFNSFEA